MVTIITTIVVVVIILDVLLVLGVGLLLGLATGLIGRLTIEFLASLIIKVEGITKWLCLHQNLAERTRELEASKIVPSRNRSDVNQYQLIQMRYWDRLFLDDISR